jgi:uncharacterized protein
VAPPDLDRPDVPPQISTWRPVLRQRLPFPAVVAHSDDDPFASAEATARLAADWGAPTWTLPRRGHLNADSGLEAWPEGLHRLKQLATGAP